MGCNVKTNKIHIFNKIRKNILNLDLNFCNSLWCTDNVYLSLHLTEKYIYNNYVSNIELIDTLKTFFLVKINGEYFYITCGKASKIYFPIQLKLRKYFDASVVLYQEKVCCHYNSDININKFKKIIKNFFKLSNYYSTNIKKLPNIYMFKNSQELKSIIKNANVDGFYDPIFNNIYLTNDIEVFNHELIHSITNNWKGWSNILISEGIAESYSAEFNNTIYERYVYHYDRNISRLFMSKDICCEDYKLLGLFMKFVMSNLGIEKLKKLYYVSTFFDNIEAIELVFNKSIRSINELFAMWFTLK